MPHAQTCTALPGLSPSIQSNKRAWHNLVSILGNFFLYLFLFFFFMFLIAFFYQKGNRKKKRREGDNKKDTQIKRGEIAPQKSTFVLPPIAA
jgi:phosphotransferase system  glucose/maltose/N-acetylglucosamine-specific IIC component